MRLEAIEMDRTKLETLIRRVADEREHLVQLLRLDPHGSEIEKRFALHERVPVRPQEGHDLPREARPVAALIRPPHRFVVGHPEALCHDDLFAHDALRFEERATPAGTRAESVLVPAVVPVVEHRFHLERARVPGVFVIDLDTEVTRSAQHFFTRTHEVLCRFVVAEESLEELRGEAVAAESVDELHGLSGRDFGCETSHF